jgi:peptide/nickel transport system permease protein
MMRRAVQTAFVLAGVVAAVFFVVRVVGDPVALMLPVEASPEARDALRAELGLDAPVLHQFWAYLTDILRGDLGDSIRHGVPALPLVLGRLPATVYLAAVTMLLALPTAVLLGALAAYRPRSLADRSINVLSLGGVSAVDFWVGLMLALLFSVTLGWLPSSGYEGPEYVILPALALALRPIGRLSQLTRSALIDEYHKPYVKMARSKGISERRIFLHILKNAGIPIVTLAGDDIADLAGGTVVVETVFAWPGLGLLLIQSIGQRDLVLVQATTLVIAVMVIVVNLVVDLSYSYLDPKVKYE